MHTPDHISLTFRDIDLAADDDHLPENLRLLAGAACDALADFIAAHDEHTAASQTTPEQDARQAAVQAYDRGYLDGHKAGYAEGRDAAAMDCVGHALNTEGATNA